MDNLTTETTQTIWVKRVFGLAIAIVVFLALQVVIPTILVGQTTAGLVVSFLVWVVEGMVVVTLSMTQEVAPINRLKIGLEAIISVPLFVGIKTVEFLSGNK